MAATRAQLNRALVITIVGLLAILGGSLAWAIYDDSRPPPPVRTAPEGCEASTARLTVAALIAEGVLVDVEVVDPEVRVMVNNRRWAGLDYSERAEILLTVNRAFAGCDYIRRLIVENEMGRPISTYAAQDIYSLQ